MQTHIKVLGWLYIVMGIFGILTAFCLATIIFGGGLISQDQTAIWATGIVSAVIGGILLVSSVPGVICGIGLINYKSWARILALILGVLNLVLFPIGTLLGIYTLYVLLDQESAQIIN